MPDTQPRKRTRDDFLQQWRTAVDKVRDEPDAIRRKVMAALFGKRGPYWFLWREPVDPWAMHLVPRVPGQETFRTRIGEFKEGANTDAFGRAGRFEFKIAKPESDAFVRHILEDRSLAELMRGDNREFVYVSLFIKAARREERARGEGRRAPRVLLVNDVLRMFRRGKGYDVRILWRDPVRDIAIVDAKPDED